MKATEILNQIKDVLGLELSEEKVALATMKLDNGTEIEAEEFVADKEVFIVGEEGLKIPLPIGDYTLEEDGKILSVVEEGLIAEIKDAEEAEAPAEEVAEEEVVEAEAEEAKVKSKTESTQVVYATKEEVSEVKLMIEEIKNLLTQKKVTKEIADVELSAEVVEPIAHNPEAATEQKTNLTQNTSSHISRIREMIYNK